MSNSFKTEQLGKIINKAYLAKKALTESIQCETELRDAMTLYNDKTDEPEDADLVHAIMEKKRQDDDIASERKRQRLAKNA